MTTARPPSRLWPRGPRGGAAVRAVAASTLAAMTILLLVLGVQHHYRHYDHGHDLARRMQGVSSPADCIFHNYTVWEEYRECVVSLQMANNDASGFDAHLLATYKGDEASRPWTEPPSSAVLVEFRPLERQAHWSIRNAMENLPVAWVIYVAGNQKVLDIARKHFPAEVAVGKVALLNLEHDNMPQHEVSSVLSSKSLYDQMKGSYWLFFQIDSAICRGQRKMLKSFIDKDYGWWGAPWASHIWRMTPYACGNGGFSLRSRELMMPILERNPAGTSGSEDGYFCGGATSMVGTLRRPPAPYYEELAFSVETMMHTKPFAVHAPWKDFEPSWEFKALVENCPEVINIMPDHGCDKFAHVLCRAEVDRSRFKTGVDTACDWEAMCNRPVNDKERKWLATLHYKVH